MGIHTKFVNLAKKLIEKNGRTLVLSKLSETPTDSDQPWRGTTGAGTTATVTGIVLDKQYVGTTASTGRAIVAAASAPNVDMRFFDGLSEGDEVWEVVSVEPLNPGEVTILWVFQLTKKT